MKKLLASCAAFFHCTAAYAAPFSEWNRQRQSAFNGNADMEIPAVIVLGVIALLVAGAAILSSLGGRPKKKKA